MPDSPWVRRVMAQDKVISEAWARLQFWNAEQEQNGNLYAEINAVGRSYRAARRKLRALLREKEEGK